MNGIISIISKPPPFVLSSSKDSEGVFQQPVSLGREMDARGTYPLHVAAEFGQPGAARALLKYGADVSLLDLENEAVALGWAAFFGRPEVAAVLLEAGSEPTQQARPYTTRLHRGRNAGQMEAVFQRDGRRVAARGRDHPFVWRVE